MKVLFSGGGTGGHVYPAIAIANKIKQHHPDAEILFVGTAAGIESDIVPKSGYDIETITVQGFRRKIDFENVKRVVKLTKGLNDARRIVKKFDPDIVIGTGGYVSGPVLFCAANKKRVTVVHEQNSFPGVTNKILSTRVSKVITCFEDAASRFHEKTREKITLVGNPVREELLQVSKEDARAKLNIPLDKKMVLCYGGSGGFDKINNSISSLISKLIKEDIAFIIATGRHYYDEVISKVSEFEFKEYQKIVPYIEDMTNALSATDVVIGSAGATSLSEITALGKASIIIPKAYTAENHQEYNARSISDKGAGICILEKELTIQSLEENLFALLNNPEKIKEMEKRSYALGKRDAADKIYETIMLEYKALQNNK